LMHWNLFRSWQLTRCLTIYVPVSKLLILSKHKYRSCEG
jgi:hypothetical protein